MGIAEDLLTKIQASFKPPAPKSERKEQRLLQLCALIYMAKSHAAWLERSANHHRSLMDLCLANPLKKMDELEEHGEEYRRITDGTLSDPLEDGVHLPPPPSQGGPTVQNGPDPPAHEDVQDPKGKNASLERGFRSFGERTAPTRTDR